MELWVSLKSAYICMDSQVKERIKGCYEQEEELHELQIQID